MRKLLLTLAVLCGTVSGWAGPTDLPEMTTDESNPIWYTIKNVRKGKYATFAGETATMTQTQQDKITQASLFYFTGSVAEGVATVKIHNYSAGNKLCAAYNSWTEAGIDWYIKAQATGVSICTSTGEWDAWNDARGEGQLIENWSASDAGSAWVIEKAYPLQGTEYLVKSGNNYFMTNLTAPTNDNPGRFVFAPDVTDVSKGFKKYKIKSIGNNNTWMSYVLADTYSAGTGKVTFVAEKEQANSWYINEYESGLYEVSPLKTNGEKFNIYMNWYGGLNSNTLDNNSITVGFWTQSGSDDPGSRWIFDTPLNENLLKADSKIVLFNTQHKTYMGLLFEGDDLNDINTLTTRRLSSQQNAYDYRHCWQLVATSYGEGDDSKECYYLYNPYYDYYVGKIVKRNTAVQMVKEDQFAGKYVIEKKHTTVVLKCLNKEGSDTKEYLHQVDWRDNGTVDLNACNVVDWQSAAGASNWKLIGVTPEQETKWQNTLTSQVNALIPYEAGNGIGQYAGLPEEKVEGFNALAIPEEGTDIEKARYCVYALFKYEGYNLAINKPAAGFYYIKSMNANDNNKKNKYWQVNEAGTQMELAVNKDEKRSIIYVGNDYKLVGYGCGSYLNHYNRISTITSNTDSLSTAEIEGGTWGIIENQQVVGTYALDHPTENWFLSDWTGGATYGSNDANAAWTFEPVESLPIKITSAGYATFYCPVAVTLPEGLTAYYVSSTTNDKAQMAEITGVVPANTGVILQGAEGSYNLTIYGGEATAVENILKGSVADTYINSESYVLSKQDDIVGFYKTKLNFSYVAEKGKITKTAEGEKGTHFLNNGFKAYLPANAVTTADARFLVFDFGGTETGIDELKGENGNVKAEVYDLAGRRVLNAKKGVFVVNGKVIVK